MKNILIKVNTPKGEKRILYTESPNKTVCEDCSYERICEHLRDPRNPEVENGTFLDFCATLTSDNLPDGLEFEINSCNIQTYHPVSGAIERALGQDYPGLVESLIKENPLVSIEEVIDNVCSDWCDMYNENKSNCCTSNSSCIIRALFNRKKKDE